MTDGERRFSCNLHVYLFYEPRKKTAIRILLQSSARLSCGKDQPMCLTWLDESRAWVLTEVALLRIYNICVQQPAGFHHFTEVCKVDSHVSRRFPTIHLKNRRTFALFTMRAKAVVNRLKVRPNQAEGSNRGLKVRQEQMVDFQMSLPSGILCLKRWKFAGYVSVMPKREVKSCLRSECVALTCSKLLGRVSQGGFPVGKRERPGLLDNPFVVRWQNGSVCTSK